jgi:hypothetical protein
MAVAHDGSPADPGLPSANARQTIRITGSGFSRYTTVLFPRVVEFGEPGVIEITASIVNADGSEIELVVPDEARTGFLRIVGTDGPGLFLQVVPTVRNVLPADPGDNFDYAVPGTRIGLFGSGFVEGDTRVTFGAVPMDDASADTVIDVLDNPTFAYFRDNGRLYLTVPERGLTAPVRVETDGGSFDVATMPIRSQVSVGLSSITATSTSGMPAIPALPSANAGQTITLSGFGFTGSSLITFRAVAHDGSTGTIVAAPATVAGDGSSMTVKVPSTAVSGPVSVSGSATSVDLQVVPTLNGVSATGFTPGASLRVHGSGIPEGGPGAGQ